MCRGHQNLESGNLSAVLRQPGSRDDSRLAASIAIGPLGGQILGLPNEVRDVRSRLSRGLGQFGGAGGAHVTRCLPRLEGLEARDDPRHLGAPLPESIRG
jgi:hypothetical protein